MSKEYGIHLESYDLFDTLITRITRTPIAVFRLLGESEAVTFRWKLAGLIPFYVWRRRAEHLARRLSSREDIRLVDIYRLLGKIIKHPARIMKLEIALEEAISRPIPKMTEQLIGQHRSGTACCVISDMYLPRHVLRKLIRSHLPEVPLHVSSEVGLTKVSGHLFQYMASAHRVSLSDIHHQGDNVVSDYAVPLRLGMQATHIPIKEDMRPSMGILDNFKCPHEGDPFYEMGFRLAGPTAFVMAACLADHVKAKATKNIIFAARDMHLVQRAFQLLRPDAITHYCRISRSAVYRAKWHADSDSQYWFEGTKNGEDFFRRLGLACPPDLCGLIPHKYPQRFLSALESLNFPHECEIEYYAVRDYLKKEGFQPNTLFVDLGWRGSIQDAVQKILAPDPPFEGWYFGTLEKHPHKYGLYFDGARPRSCFHHVIQAISFFEFLFTEATPSLERIVRNGEAFELISTHDETQEQVASRLRIAEGAGDFIAMMAKIHNLANFRCRNLLLSLDKLYGRYLMTPPSHWVASMDSMTHAGGFGGSGISSLIGDDTATPLGFLKAPWKGGYVVKHRRSAWAPLFKVMHRPTFFTAYDAFKMTVRRHRAMNIKRQG